MERDDNGKKTFSINTDSTIERWEEFAEDSRGYYGFGSVDLQKELENRRQALAEEIKTARDQNNTEVNTQKLAGDRANLEKDIAQIRRQPDLLKETLSTHTELLKDWAKENRDPIRSQQKNGWLEQRDRRHVGLARDQNKLAGRRRTKTCNPIGFVASIQSKIWQLEFDQSGNSLV